MDAWTCAGLIAGSGAIGGTLNALLTANGFLLPQRVKNVLCPGFLTNVIVGASSALASWAFYGSGSSVDLAHMNEHAIVSFQLSSLATAFFIGVAGSRWLTNEADKKMLQAATVEAAERQVSPATAKKLLRAPARKCLQDMMKA